VEWQAFGQLLPGLQARLSLSYQSPKITKEGISGQPVGSRIYYVPYATGSVALIYTHRISDDTDGFVSTDYSYTGNALDSITYPPITRAGYGILNAKIGSEWGSKRLWLYFKNITNVKANLGGVAAESYLQTNPTTGLLDPRVGVERPLQVGIGFSCDF
jgi:hypothetical protein